MSDKVIIAAFGKTRTARTATQYQYNHGQKLQFENVDLPANYEVHFSNSINGTAKTVIGDSTGVVIPYEYFVPGSTIYAWIYVTDEDSGITIRKVEIPIAMKAKPTDQPLDPEDESLVEQVLNRLNDTIDEIPEAIDAALEEAKESGEFDGPKGDPFTYEDFTPEQLAGLKGPKGDPFTYEDFTPEQLAGLKGPKGDAFTYDDFTPEELEDLTGPQGPEGSTIWTTNTPYSYSQETGRYYFAASTLRGPTGATQKEGDLVYLSDDTNQEYKAFYIVDFQYGGLQVGCRYLANMQGPPGEGATGAVLYNEAQSLTETEKNRARQNIGAASISDLGVVFRLKGEVNNVEDLPFTGNRVGDVYFVRSKSVGYVWLETYGILQGYWEELGEPIDISNLPDTITWFAGTVDANDNFTPAEDEFLTVGNIVRAINNNRLPIIAVSFSDGTIIKLPLLHHSFTNNVSDYFVFYTVTSMPSKSLQLVNPKSEFYRVSYYKTLTSGGTPVWRTKYDHGYFVEPETIGDLSDLNTTDKSSIVNAINEVHDSQCIITYTVGQNIVCDHSYSEILSAGLNGSSIIVRITGDANGQTANAFFDPNTYNFVVLLPISADSVYKIIHTSADVISDSLQELEFDSELSDGSVNAVQNAVIKAALDAKANTIDIPTRTSELENDSGFLTSPVPKTDLAFDVQISLDKADTALQSVPPTYRTAAAQDTIDEAQDTAIAGKLSTTGNAYRALSIPMGYLDNTSTATVMTANVPGITELRDGVCMWLRNGVITSASGFTLDINSLGAKPVYSSLAAATRSTTIFNVNYACLFIYNSTRVEGGCWDIVYGIDTNTTYSPYSLGFGYGTCTTAAATVAKTASISSSYKLVAGGIVAIKFDNDVPAGATLNINSKGAKAIYYRGATITAGIIKAGDTVTMIYSTYYHVLAIDRDDNTEILKVTYTDPGNGQAITCDRTYAEIYAALMAKKPIAVYGIQNGMIGIQDTNTSLELVSGDLLISHYIAIDGKNYYRIRHSSTEIIVADVIDTTNDKLDKNLGVSEVGKFLVVGSNGYVTTMTLSTWQGGNYGS